MQLLMINLVTDSLPAIALGMEDVEADVMDKKPKPKNEGIFAGGLGVRVVLQGCMFAFITLLGFWLGEKQTGTLEGGQTLAFMILALSQIVQAFNMRSERSLLAIGPFTNKTLNLAALTSILITAITMLTPIRVAFGLVILPTKLYFVGIRLILVPFVVMEFSKFFRQIKKKHKNV